ncbi:hypothetical protein AUK40_03540 [Candidatus Wirthbacteria bacterium CG2_30_54_11]|uniref:O-antigen ligase-related domain-containing protein n=1 Tax=Candidatus Wirthbacteria bacterium CG2_30_54_11 TaxID=1817892 RepID=A0A1J5IKR0_9BACT|nr:MAG: hypothetical protein AUK40_03540 [Candidatus Wirthbacteria bacterium CG2_30_54_11]
MPLRQPKALTLITNFSFRQTLQTTAFILLALIFAVAPLIYHAQAFLVFDIPKLTLIQGGIELAFTLYLISVLAGPWARFRWHRPSRTIICLLVYILLAVLSTLTAYSPRQAWWGSTYRRQGLFLLFHYLALFWMVLDIGRNRWHRRIILAGVVSGGLSLAIISLLEYWNIPAYSSWKSAGAYAGRLVGSFGQPNYTAAYLGMTLPFFFLGLRAKSAAFRLLSSLGLLCSLIALWGTGSRSTWMGLIIVAACFTALTFRRQILLSKSIKTTAFLGSIAVCLVGLSLLSTQNSLSWRIGELLHPEGWNKIERFQIWDRSLTLIAQKPLLGYGLDNLELVFPGSLRSTDTHLMTVYVDRAHSLFLDQAAAVGIPGTIAWLFFLGAALLRTVRLSWLRDRNWWKLSCAFGIALYLVRGSMDMGNITLDALLWLLLALMLADNRPPDRQAEQTQPPLARILSFAIVLPIIAFCAGLIGTNYRIMQADILYKQGLRQENASPETAAALWQKAIKANPQVELYRLKLADLALRQGYDAIKSENKDPWNLIAATALLSWDQRGGESADYYFRRGQLYQYAQTTVTSDWQELSSRYFEQAHRLAPYKFASP